MSRNQRGKNKTLVGRFFFWIINWVDADFIWKAKTSKIWVNQKHQRWKRSPSTSKFSNATLDPFDAFFYDNWHANALFLQEGRQESFQTGSPNPIPWRPGKQRRSWEDKADSRRHLGQGERGCLGLSDVSWAFCRVWIHYFVSQSLKIGMFSSR